MWTFQTEMASYLSIDKSRGGKAVDDHFLYGFLYATLVSDRSLRPVKNKLKVSGQFKSTEDTQQYATLQSIVQSARKCGQDPLIALLAVAEL